jgi:hypothetical protein
MLGNANYYWLSFRSYFLNKDIWFPFHNSMGLPIFIYNILHNGQAVEGSLKHSLTTILVGRRGRDRMVVGFTTAYVISAYHH